MIILKKIFLINVRAETRITGMRVSLVSLYFTIIKKSRASRFMNNGEHKQVNRQAFLTTFRSIHCGMTWCHVNYIKRAQHRSSLLCICLFVSMYMYVYVPIYMHVCVCLLQHIAYIHKFISYQQTQSNIRQIKLNTLDVWIFACVLLCACLYLPSLPAFMQECVQKMQN